MGYFEAFADKCYLKCIELRYAMSSKHCEQHIVNSDGPKTIYGEGVENIWLAVS